MTTTGAGVPVAGATVRLGAATAVTDADGVAPGRRSRGGPLPADRRARRHGAVVAAEGGRGVRRRLAAPRLLVLGARRLRAAARAAGDVLRRRRDGADGHARLRRRRGRARRAQDDPRRRDRDAPAAAQVRRSRRATAAASCRRSTASRAAGASGRPVDWFFYVNGIEADVGAAARKLVAGRPRVVGPPRLGRGDADPGGGRLVPGAVRVGRAGQEAPDPDRLRRRRA